jgi:hypothetical protein
MENDIASMRGSVLPARLPTPAFAALPRKRAHAKRDSPEGNIHKRQRDDTYVKAERLALPPVRDSPEPENSSGNDQRSISVRDPSSSLHEPAEALGGVSDDDGTIDDGSQVDITATSKRTRLV